ncbi:putative reverse transcriptase domain-containing protein [Tanacetum coccineum]|uniref:Reverse transcriptase domain-containing protein n=1 Tax=Tanacetum coccineum TaxID=301880 RepID=A0ABQ5EW25_9ASTR
MVRAGHAAYTDRFHELSRLVPHLITLENKRIERYIYGLAPQIRAMVAATEPTIIPSVVLKARMLTDKAIRNGSMRKNTEKVGPRMVNPVNARNPIAARGLCFECGSTDHYKAACPRLNRAPRLGEEAHRDPNIVTGTFTLNNHYATTLFDSGADYSFVSTTFIPLIDIEPNNLGFSYEIEIASGQLVDINKTIRGCKLEIEVHTFDIDLIPFGHSSFDVIVGMDWLSRHKAEIVFHEKVVRIPLPNGEMLRVLGERLEEKVRHLMSAKPEEQKLEDIVVVRNYSELLGHVINGEGIHIDPSKIEAVKNWEAPKTPSKEQEATFQTLKDKLCNAPVLALSDGLEDFVVYCDASCLGLGTKSVIYTNHKSLQHILNRKELNMQQRRWIELFSDYDCEIRYHPGKANVVADALSKKERINPKRVRAMNMTIQSSIKDKILAAQNEASEAVNALAEMLRGLDKQMERRSDGTFYYLDQI